MIQTLRIWVAKCDYPGCIEFIRMDEKKDLVLGMKMTGWKLSSSSKIYCYNHAHAEGAVKLENSDEELIYVHSQLLCDGRPCPLHNRTDHHMRKFPQHWRDERQFMERICTHGIGHPDPDQWDFLVRQMGKKGAKAEFIHGCCHEGCCIKEKVAG